MKRILEFKSFNESNEPTDEFYDCAEVYLQANEGDLGGEAQMIANSLRDKYQYDSSKDSNEIYDDLYDNYTDYKFIHDIKELLGDYLN